MSALSRRDALLTLSSLGALGLLRCGPADGGVSTEDGGTTVVTQGDAGVLQTDAGAVGSTTLAVGSGAFLADKSYGDPFGGDLGTACVAWKAATQGPCHSNTFHRKDLTDGLVGLPTRVELLVLNTACSPVANAIVEVWYASPAGTYSAAASAADDAGTSYHGSAADLNTSFCTGNAAAALSSAWLRAYQTTDAQGRVTFDGIYPGWYASRTTHVHFRVTVGATTYITSQLFFDDALSAAVYGTHGSYASRGAKDTSNASDKVIQEAGLTLSQVTMASSVQSDGALVVWKPIVIAS